MVSPYAGEGASKAGYFTALGLWTIWVVALSCMSGGYLAGRLRHRIGDASEHEVEVRDGSHGIGVWALSVVIAYVVLAMGVSGLVGTAAKVAGPAAAVAANDPNAATLDALFRRDVSETSGNLLATPSTHARAVEADRAEISRLLTDAPRRTGLSASDRTYVARIVAANTGMSQREAEERVDQTLAEAKRKADAARKLGILTAFATAAALLIGGAAAAWASTMGGRHRDRQTDFSVFWRWS
jgi:hypothetical protein